MYVFVLDVNPVYVPSSFLIALSEPLVCRSQCCQHSLSLSFVVQMQLFWQPSGVSWPPAAASLSFPVSGLLPGGGGGGGPWVAFLVLEVGAASPGGESMGGGLLGGGWVRGEHVRKKTDIFEI